MNSNLEKIRNKLNQLMKEDQKYHNPASRKTWQASRVWPFIQQNLKLILSDVGDDKKGSYPAAPFAAWLLVQHMDAFPQHQEFFLKNLITAKLNPTDGKGGAGKLQFLQDRVKVNKEILRLFASGDYRDKHGKPLTDPLSDVRNPNKFDDAGQNPTTAMQALANAKKAGNILLVTAVKNTRVKTQPSFNAR